MTEPAPLLPYLYGANVASVLIDRRTGLVAINKTIGLYLAAAGGSALPYTDLQEPDGDPWHAGVDVITSGSGALVPFRSAHRQLYASVLDDHGQEVGARLLIEPVNLAQLLEDEATARTAADQLRATTVQLDTERTERVDADVALGVRITTELGALSGSVDQRVADAVAILVGTAPAALDTLQELAAALNDDADFAASVTVALSERATVTALGLATDRIAELEAQSAETESAIDDLGVTSLRVIPHGDDPLFARPAWSGPALWIGTVQPVGMLADDIYGPVTVIPVEPDVAWLASHTAVTLSTDGSSWPSSNSSRALAQATSTKRPTKLTVEDRTWLSFDGGDALAYAFSGARAQPITIGMVIDLPALPANGVTWTLLDSTDTTNRFIISVIGTASGAELRSYAGTDLARPAITTGRHAIFFVANSGSSKLRVDGVEVASGGAGTRLLGGITLGSNPAQGGSFFTGRVAELRYIDTDLAPALITQTEAAWMAEGKYDIAAVE